MGHERKPHERPFQSSVQCTIFFQGTMVGFVMDPKTASHRDSKPNGRPANTSSLNLGLQRLPGSKHINFLSKSGELFVFVYS